MNELIGKQRHGVVYSSSVMVNKIFLMAKPYSILSRKVNVTSDRIEKKAKRLLSSSRVDADLFAQLVYAIRKKRKHRGISPIKPGGRDWDLVKEITASALGFCEEFELYKREGFIRYIEIGISKMAKFNINKFPNLYEAICETHLAMDEISKDENPNSTKEMYDYYISHIAEHTGIFENLQELPEKYVWFVRARVEADKIKVPGIVYIKAQFSGLDFAKGIPHPIQLVGPKAIDRVNRYSYKRNFKGEYNNAGVRRISLKGILDED
jgi:hypothetical protein